MQCSANHYSEHHNIARSCGTLFRAPLQAVLSVKASAGALHNSAVTSAAASTYIDSVIGTITVSEQCFQKLPENQGWHVKVCKSGPASHGHAHCFHFKVSPTGACWPHIAVVSSVHSSVQTVGYPVPDGSLCANWWYITRCTSLLARHWKFQYMQNSESRAISQFLVTLAKLQKYCQGWRELFAACIDCAFSAITERTVHPVVFGLSQLAKCQALYTKLCVKH